MTNECTSHSKISRAEAGLPMRFLFLSDAYPEFDRNSADFRLAQLMASMRAYGEVDFWAISEEQQAAGIGHDDTLRYKEALTVSGIGIATANLASVVANRAYDAVFIEWYFSAAPQIEVVRSASPATRIVTDSVDVVFNRLRAKARVSGSAEDSRKAEEVRRLETETYRQSDLVLTVSDQDAQILAAEDSSIKCFTIPNIHPLHDCAPMAANATNTLIFVGSKSEANDDAMRYFCVDVLPMILEREPTTLLRVVGTVEVPVLDGRTSRSVERLGFVPDTRPYLESSLISVAPLRFGGGMKGKVGEAMSYGLPVVTSSIGAEGFGIQPGREALVADDARAFADAVVKLIRDPDLREAMRLAGWNFIRENYSDVAVNRRVRELIDCIKRITPKRLPLFRQAYLSARSHWNRHISWRFR